MKCFLIFSVLLVQRVTSQDVKFNGDEKAPVEGDDVNTRTEELSEDDVNTRFFNLDLNSFAGQVAAASLGTVIGNTGTNLASNYLSGCNNRGKRSVLMHKLEKRQAVEASEKSGNPDADPEVQTRLFCPQDLLSGGNNNGGSYCDRCNCRDYSCNRDCRKCGYNNNQNQNYGWSSNNNGYPSNNNNYGTNTWSSGSSNGNYNSGSTTTYVNCNSCSCRYSSCKSCSKCRTNTNYYPSSNSGSSWSSNSGSNYNNGWRSSNAVNGRTGANSDDAEEVVLQDKTEEKTENEEESVVFA